MPSPPGFGVLCRPCQSLSAEIVGKRRSNTPALRRDGAGVLFCLFPHMKEGWWPSAHSESKSLPFRIAFPLTPHFVREAWRLVPRCLFPHSHSQGAQEIPPFPFSRKGIQEQGSPLWLVTGSPLLYKMYGCSTRSSPAPGSLHSELPGRLADTRPFGAAGEKRHRGCIGPSSQAGLGLKQGKKLLYSFKDGNLSHLGVGFQYDESLFDPQEALSVERTFVPLQCDEAGCWRQPPRRTHWGCSTCARCSSTPKTHNQQPNDNNIRYTMGRRAGG